MGYPYYIPCIDRWYPFHIPCLEITKPERFPDFFTTIKNAPDSPFYLGHFTDRNERFRYRFIHFNQWNPYPFIYLSPEKGTPFGRSLPVNSIIGREYHLGQPVKLFDFMYCSFIDGIKPLLCFIIAQMCLLIYWVLLEVLRNHWVINCDYSRCTILYQNFTVSLITNALCLSYKTWDFNKVHHLHYSSS